VYATLVCVTCSQLEKLRTALLEIRQTYVKSVKKFGDEAKQLCCEEQVYNSEQIFTHMQKQLNYCIRHPQEIRRCGFKTIY
jgi:hypothetical protein